jgi:hypothetical protein
VTNTYSLGVAAIRYEEEINTELSVALHTLQPIVQQSIVLGLWSRPSTPINRDLHLPLMPLVAIQNAELMKQRGFTVSLTGSLREPQSYGAQIVSILPTSCLRQGK